MSRKWAKSFVHSILPTWQKVSSWFILTLLHLRNLIASAFHLTLFEMCAFDSKTHEYNDKKCYYYLFLRKIANMCKYLLCVCLFHDLFEAYSQIVLSWCWDILRRMVSNGWKYYSKTFFSLFTTSFQIYRWIFSRFLLKLVLFYNNCSICNNTSIFFK